MAGAPPRDHWLARMALAIGGGLLFASAAAACLGLLLLALGADRPQAAEAATLASLAIYLVAALVAFADISLMVIAAGLLGGGALMAGLALALRAI